MQNGGIGWTPIQAVQALPMTVLISLFDMDALRAYVEHKIWQNCLKIEFGCQIRVIKNLIKNNYIQKYVRCQLQNIDWDF